MHKKVRRSLKHLTCFGAFKQLLDAKGAPKMLKAMAKAEASIAGAQKERDKVAQFEEQAAKLREKLGALEGEAS